MFNRVVVSTDENPDFLDFIPLVSMAWKKFFPQAELSIAFVTDRSMFDGLVGKMLQYGDVSLFPTFKEIPTANHAKIARHILAGCFDDVCMIEDVDTIPLQASYFESRTALHQPGKLLAVGKEVYGIEHPNKFPISTMTAQGKVFQSIFNPTDADYNEIFKNLNRFKDKADICTSPQYFSDESLIKELLSGWSGEVVHARRGVNIKEDWIDRSWWDVDEDKLNRGEYVTCNMLRGARRNFKYLYPLYKYIWGRDVTLEEVTL